MKHNLQISVSDKPRNLNCVSCKSITVRERIMRMLFGKEQEIMVFVPSDKVEELAITRVMEGGRQ